MGVPQKADHQLKVPVVRRSEYSIFLEQATPSITIGHIDIYRFTPRVVRQLHADWKVLLDLHGGPIHVLHTPGDSKHLKFITLFGFKFTTRFTNLAGHAQEVYSSKD